MGPERAFFLRRRALWWILEITTHPAGSSDAQGQTHSQDKSAQKDDKGCQKHITSEIEMVGSHNCCDEENHHSHCSGQASRMRQLFTECPDKRASCQVMAQPGTGQNNDRGNDQSRNQQYECLNQLSSQVCPEHAQSRKYAERQNAPIGN